MRFAAVDFNYLTRGEKRTMDITILFKIAAIGIIITVICQILKKSDRDDIATLVSIVGLVIVLAVVVGMIGDLFQQIQEIFGLN